MELSEIIKQEPLACLVLSGVMLFIMALFTDELYTAYTAIKKGIINMVMTEAFLDYENKKGTGTTIHDLFKQPVDYAPPTKRLTPEEIAEQARIYEENAAKREAERQEFLRKQKARERKRIRKAVLKAKPAYKLTIKPSPRIANWERDWKNIK